MLSAVDGKKIKITKVASKRYVKRGDTLTVAVSITGVKGHVTVSLRTRQLNVKKVFTREKNIKFQKAGEFTVVEFMCNSGKAEFGLDCKVIGPGSAFGGKVVSDGNETEHQNLRLVFLRDPQTTAFELNKGSATTLSEAIVSEQKKLLSLEILRDQGDVTPKEFNEKKKQIEKILENIRSDLLHKEHPKEIEGRILLSSTGKRLELARNLIDSKRGEGDTSARKKKLKELIG